MNIEEQKEALKNCTTREEWEGVASANKEFKTEVAELDVIAAQESARIDPVGWFEWAARVLGRNPEALKDKIGTINRFGDILKDYPRLTGGHLSVLYFYGITKEGAPAFLEWADTEGASQKKLGNYVKKVKGIPDKTHACEKCGKVHRIGKHND